jgi:2-dehydropantoate 2-reductase
LWAKFAGFTSVASIATLMRSRAGVITRAGASHALIEAAFTEVAAVAAAEGYPPPDNIKAVVLGLYSQPESSYGPSILVDMENGRTTEGEHTVGDIVGRAQRHRIAAPILTAARYNLQIYEAQIAPRPR